VNGSNMLTLPKVISGISKTLNIVNQAIPIYQQVKPIIANAGNILKIFNEINTPDSNNKNNNVQKDIDYKDAKIIETKKEPIYSNGLTFFQ
jgi:hypothetical protein